MKFQNYQLCTVYANYSDSGNVKYTNILVDKINQRLIYPTYRLSTPKDTTATGVDCYVMELPMVINEDGSVQVSYQTMTHKINARHYKRVDYEDVIKEFNRDFSIFL